MYRLHTFTLAPLDAVAIGAVSSVSPVPRTSSLDGVGFVMSGSSTSSDSLIRLVRKSCAACLYTRVTLGGWF